MEKRTSRFLRMCLPHADSAALPPVLLSLLGKRLRSLPTTELSDSDPVLSQERHQQPGLRLKAFRYSEDHRGGLPSPTPGRQPLHTPPRDRPWDSGEAEGLASWAPAGSGAGTGGMRNAPGQESCASGSTAVCRGTLSYVLRRCAGARLTGRGTEHLRDEGHRHTECPVQTGNRRQSVDLREAEPRASPRPGAVAPVLAGTAGPGHGVSSVESSGTGSTCQPASKVTMFAKQKTHRWTHSSLSLAVQGFLLIATSSKDSKQRFIIFFIRIALLSP